MNNAQMTIQEAQMLMNSIRMRLDLDLDILKKKVELFNNLYALPFNHWDRAAFDHDCEGAKQ